MKNSVLSALAGLATIVGSAPTPTSPQVQSHIKARQGTGTSTAPCAQVSQFMYGNGTTVVQRQVPAKIAFDCINSVPFNATSAKRLIPALRPYINWQSTLATLKNPPAEYADKVQPPVDILGGLSKIEADIDAGRFTSEYDFGWTLYTLIQSAHDGHFSYVPDSVSAIFSWGRSVPLVSVSEDGIQLPAVFAYEDVLGLQFKNISYTPSPIVQIDDMEAAKFLESLSQYGSLQDRDALYNNVFYELAQIGLADSGSGTGMFTGGGRGRWVYPGGTTTLKFANGTERTLQNYATVINNFRGINSGEDLASKWFSWGSDADATVLSPTDLSSSSPISIAADDIAVAAAPGYPTPLVAGPFNLINAFFIDAPGYEDVAVLQVPNFVGMASAQARFQQTTQEFIPKALAAGKTKLIIDLQANGGGTIMQGYDLFKQLFPDIDPYGANRYRATEALDLIGQAYSAYGSQLPRIPGKNRTAEAVQSSYFDYHTDMTVDGKSFSSWAEKFGPVETNGEKFTTSNRWNLSDVYIPYISGGIAITGYGNLSNITGPPKFKPENIVLLTDGYCASTCSIFSELMTKQAGVKTIAMGGRSNKNPIQAIGGVKGVNNYQFGYVQSLVQRAVIISPELANSTLRRDYYSDIPFNRGGGSMAVNVRDGLLLNDTSGTALQFIYEEANCRLFYTPEMTVDITSVWRAAADAQWGNNGKCISAGYSHKRGAYEVTSKLNPRGLGVSRVAAMKQVKAFEDTFSLETHSNKMSGDGFMQP